MMLRRAAITDRLRSDLNDQPFQQKTDTVYLMFTILDDNHFSYSRFHKEAGEIKEMKAGWV